MFTPQPLGVSCSNGMIQSKLSAETDENKLALIVNKLFGWRYEHNSFWGNNAPIVFEPLRSDTDSCCLLDALSEVELNRSPLHRCYQCQAAFSDEDFVVVSIPIDLSTPWKSRRRAIFECAYEVAMRM